MNEIPGQQLTSFWSATANVITNILHRSVNLFSYSYDSNASTLAIIRFLSFGPHLFALFI